MRFLPPFPQEVELHRACREAMEAGEYMAAMTRHHEVGTGADADNRLHHALSVFGFEFCRCQRDEIPAPAVSRLDKEKMIIQALESLSPEDTRIQIAIEIGHHVLFPNISRCPTTDCSEAEICTEAAAIWARAFLMPASDLAQMKDSREIARSLGLSKETVELRLEDLDRYSKKQPVTTGVKYFQHPSRTGSYSARKTIKGGRGAG